MLHMFHTVRHLKAEQLIYRLYYRFHRVHLSANREVKWRKWRHKWCAPALLPSRMPGPDCFEFFGEESLLKDKTAWNDAGKRKLWLYNLHYLDDLNAVGADLRREQHRELIGRWIAENPPADGNGWEPYPLSLRIVNLVKWFSREGLVEPAWLISLALQAQALYKQLEFHILGNHLFANAKALVFAGAYLDGDGAQQWLKKGLHILDREIPEQFLPDGGHFELSPMYHAILLSDLCDLLNLADHSGLGVLRERVTVWREVIERGLTWLKAMSHPDGRFGFFNDTALHVAPDAEAIKAYATSLGCGLAPQSSRMDSGGRKIRLHYLENSGYCRVEMPNSAVALLDLARIGPDYQPGHAHADTLSFELSLFNRRVLVNSGTSQYGEGSERQRQRGTAAHNTVVIDGADSSEVWGAFRVARRAYPNICSMGQIGDSVVVEASHNGYRRLRGKPVHRRRWTFTERSLLVQDTITGNYQRAEARFHLHPDVTIDRRDFFGGQLSLLLPNGERVGFSVRDAKHVELVTSMWHPTFGASVPNVCIVAEFGGRALTSRIEWEDRT